MAFIWVWLHVAFLLNGDFKTEQLQHDRVKEAYLSKGSLVYAALKKHQIVPTELNLYLRAFKREQILEVWGKNNSDEKFQLLQTMPICHLSGNLGPKRREGDLQIPEGFYAVDGFNPGSQFYLSLHLNYPNKSDQILGYQPKLGGLIFLHGDCVTIGCLPLTDEKIKELYVYCVEARTSGQTSIPITIFPARLTETNFKSLAAQYAKEMEKVNLWTDLKLGYQYFENNKKLPTITFLPDGRHLVE